MKTKTLISLAIAALGVASIASALGGTPDESCCSGMSAQHSQAKNEQPVPAKEVKGVQTLTVTIADGKYSPALISVKKGKAVALTFKGGKNMGCGSTVEFKSLKQKQSVKEGKTVVFKFAPKEAGEIKFACSMDMIQGRVVVK